MTLEQPILPYFEWLLPSATRPGALLFGLMVILIVFLASLLVAYLITVLRHGPVEALGIVGSGLAQGVVELANTSPRRTWAIARLAFQEAIRRRVLVAFGVFVVVMLFASWYLDVQTDNPARLYMGVVLGWTNLLVLILALFLSTFSLPGDIKNRTIYTVVTKPVHLSEIVLGRMIGFTLIGTLILGVMCLASYLFVVRGLSHEHIVELSSLREDPTIVDEEGRIGLSGQTSEDSYHRHAVFINADGTGYTDIQKGHRHTVRRVGDGANVKYVVGPPVGQLEARVPKRGKLSFLDRAGNPSAKGINVGNEWTYRSYIEGGTLAAATWTFDGVTQRAFDRRRPEFKEGLPLELTLRVFRTYKGDINRGILGSIEVVEYVDPDGPEAGRVPLVSQPINFYAKEFSADQRTLPWQLKARRGTGPLQDVDLLDDMAREGKLLVRIRCLEGAQYYGAAEGDVYIRAGENSFFWNFVKGYVSIWFQMVLLIGFGVVFSTFLSGPVAMLATAMAFLMGYCANFIADLFSGKLEGGGPMEALIRTAEQRNLVTPFEQSWGTAIIQTFDFAMLLVMRGVSIVMPQYGSFNTSNFVASGYNIDGNLMAEHFTVAFTFFLVLAVLGYFIFRSREIAA